jgi:nicotinate-nucleotide adenylyltransferase
MRVGLFGGTFDPVHNGHLRVAEEVREFFFLDRVYFIPTFIQPLKQNLKAADAEDRFRMLRMALGDNGCFRVSRLEIRKRSVSYSIDTVRAFGKRFSDLYFIIGVDAFSDLRFWRDYKELLSATNFIVMTRPTHGSVRLAELLPEDVRGAMRGVDASVCEHLSGRKSYLHPITQLDVSSTKIRELHKQGRSIKYLLPRSVEEFIQKRGLYSH